MCTENHHWHHDYVRLAWDSGFCFDPHKAKSNFDWSSLGLVDIDKVSRDRDIAIVEKHVTTVLHFALDEDQTKILDPTFVKVFRLGQLSVQYLQFCKRYLDNTVVLLKKQLSKTSEENSHLKEHCDELETEIADLKKKLKEFKYQSAPVMTGEANIKCGECAKMFLTEEYLLAHVKRRHAANPLQKETDKLQLEIKELKERLNSAVQVENLSQNAPGGDAPPRNDGRVDLLQEKFERLKEQVERELNALRDQKQYQEKFELVFERLENLQKELSEKKDDADKICTKENWAQTVSEIPQQDQDHKKNEEKTAEPDLTLVKKMQEDLRINTESHLGQIQDALQQKLTGGLEQLQTQMNTFWEKINELQPAQDKNDEPPEIRGRSPPPPKIESPVETPQQIVFDRPKPAPRVTKSADLKRADHVILPERQTYFVTTTKEPAASGGAIKSATSVESGLSSKPKRKVRKAKKPKATTMGNPRSVERETPLTSSSASDFSDAQLKRKEAQAKPSNTSTLAQRSITRNGGNHLKEPTFKIEFTSLKNLLNDRDVREGLKGELEEMVNVKLKEVGVSPQWTGLPARTYSQCLKILMHSSQLYEKRNPMFSSVRAHILDEVDRRMLGILSTKSKSDEKPYKKIGKSENVRDDEGPKVKVAAALTPTKKKVLFDLGTSSSTSAKSKKRANKEDVQDKENLSSLTRQNVELLIGQPRTIFKNLDTDTSVASSVLDGSKKTVAKTTTAKDEVSDWEMSDILI